MLKDIKKWSGRFAAQLLIYAVAASFAVWGITDFITGGSSNTAVTINGTPVSVQEVDRTYRTLSDGLAQQLGGVQLDPQIAKELNIPGQTLTEVMRRVLVVQAAKKLDLAVSDKQLYDEIQAMPAFQEDGKFNREQYKRILHSNGLSPALFERNLRDELLTDTLQQFFRFNRVNPAQVAPLLAYEKTTLDVQYLRFTQADAPAFTAPAANEIQARYDANPDRYKTPETRNVITLVLPADSDQYDLQNSIADKIAGGEKLPAIAKALNLKTTEIKNLTARDNRLLPALNQAATALKAGEVSNEVTLPADAIGYVEVVSVAAAKQQSLADVRANIVADIKSEQQQNALQTHVQAALKLAQEKGLSAAQAKFGGTLGSASGIGRQGQNAPAWLQGPALNLAFAIGTGNVVPVALTDGQAQFIAQPKQLNVPNVSPKDIANALPTVERQFENDLSWLFLYNEFGKAKVSYNSNALRLVFGDSFDMSQVPVKPQASWRKLVPFL